MRTIDCTMALIKKRLKEKISSFRKGNFDLTGFILRLVLAGALVAVFSVFFGKFLNVYLGVRTNGSEDRAERLYELLTITYFLILVFSAVGSAAALHRELFSGDDLKILSAMPVRPFAIYLSGTLTVLAGQFLVALITILPVNLVAAAYAPRGNGFYILTAASCFLLPLLSVAIGSVLSLPIHALLSYLKPRYLLTLVLVTLLAAGGFWVYAQILGGVKELLLGDDLKYFFNERITSGIALVCRGLYPANLLVRIILGIDLRRSLLFLLGIALACFMLSLPLERWMIPRAMQTRVGSAGRTVRRGEVLGKRTVFFAILKKEFIEILRTPGYAFSCFSTAAVLPLMVYFCMSVGSSLVKRLIGMDCNLELALLLTLLLGSLCNVFCSTNVSREGENFYTLKALPISAWKLFGAKLLFCLLVSTVAQGITAGVLAAAGYVSRGAAIFLFGAGTVYSFAQICFATRYDFARARFSSEEDGAAGESGGAASAVIVLGLLGSFSIGGIALVMKLISALRLGRFDYGAIPFGLAGGLLAIFAVLAFWYFAWKLRRRYYEFSGGGLL